MEESLIQNNSINDIIFAEPLYIHSEDKPKFISKVYSILWIQLLLTSIFIGLCSQYNVFHDYMLSQNGQTVYTITNMMLFIIIIMLYCQPNNYRDYPNNWIMLSLFTLLMVYNMGLLGAIIPINILLLSGITTLGLFSGLTLYAIQTKIDYTIRGNILLVLLIGLIIFGFMVSFINLPFKEIIYGILGSIIFSFYIIYDTQQIVGGNNRKIHYNKNDFVLASINLYLDIINLFVSIIDTLSGR